MRSKLGLSVSALIVVLLILGSVAPVANAKLAVAQPKLDQLLTGPGKVTIVIRTAPNLRKLQVRLEGKGVRGAFKQVRSGTWRARISPGKLRNGRNHLVVKTVDRAGRRDFASSRFVRGRHRPGFLKLEAPKRTASSAVAGVHTRSYPNLRFRAKLNGRPVANRFLRSYLTDRTAYLGANDGLRFGRNVLEVLAARGNGTYDFERRVIVVRRDRPLVGAGPDRLTEGKRAVRLDGRRSRASQAAGGGAAAAASGLRYRWKVIERPKGSRARPASPAAARTGFRPDAIGTYRLRLTVTDGRGLRGSDVVTVTDVASAPPIGLPIETLLNSGEAQEEEFWMEIGGERVGQPLHLNFAQPNNEWVAALFLDRLTLEVLHAENYDGSEAEAQQLEREMESYGQRALVVLYQPYPLAPYRAGDPAFAGAVEKLGVKAPPELTEFGYSAIGVPGSGDGGTVIAGTNWERPSAGRLRGYLARDSSGLFNYVSSSAIPFDTSAPGAAEGRNRIEVGGRIFESEPFYDCPMATGGFQIAVLYAETLEPVFGRTYSTNGCGKGFDGEEVEAIAELIGEFEKPQNPNYLVEKLGRDSGNKIFFIQTIGSPRDPAVPDQWAELAKALEKIGATGSVFANSTASYSLVGSIATYSPEEIEGFPLTEASETLTGAPARITGILQPDDVGSYAPLVSSSSGATSFDLAEVAYQPAQPWPSSETAGQKAALTYIAELLDLPQPTVESSCYVPPQPDVRSEYCNEALRGEWAGLVGQVRGAECNGSCQSEHGFSQEDWENVRAELVGRGNPGEFVEFNAVQSTWELMRVLQAPFGASGVDAEVNLNKLATEIEQALKPKPESQAEGDWLDILSAIVYTASYVEFDDPFTAPLIGTLAGAIGIGAEYANGSEGSPLLGEFQLSAADLAVDLAKNLEAGSAEIGTLGELIVTDYGKLKAVSSNPALAGFTPKAAGSATEALGTGGMQWTYRTLFPTAYEAVTLQPGGENPTVPERAADYLCSFAEYTVSEAELVIQYHPFSPVAQAEYHPGQPAQSALLIERGAVLPGHKRPQSEPKSPPASLLEPIYKPLSQGGVGLYVPWFWRQSFGFPGPTVKDISC